MGGFRYPGLAAPYLRHVAIDLARPLSDRRRRIRIERASDDMLDGDEIGRRTKVEEEGKTRRSEVGLQSLKGVSPSTGKHHDSLFVVANAGDYRLPAKKGREQEIVLRVGRVLEFVDEDEGIGGDERATDMWIGAQQKLGEAIYADK